MGKEHKRPPRDRVRAEGKESSRVLHRNGRDGVFRTAGVGATESCSLDFGLRRAQGQDRRRDRTTGCASQNSPNTSHSTFDTVRHWIVAVRRFATSRGRPPNDIGVRSGGPSRDIQLERSPRSGNAKTVSSEGTGAARQAGNTQPVAGAAGGPAPCRYRRAPWRSRASRRDPLCTHTASDDRKDPRCSASGP